MDIFFFVVFFFQVILNVVMNFAGVAFAIAAIVLYVINMTDLYLWWICHDDYYYDRGTKAPVDENLLQKCEEGVTIIDVSFINTSSTTTRDEIQIVYQVLIDKPTDWGLHCVISIHPLWPSHWDPTA